MNNINNDDHESESVEYNIKDESLQDELQQDESKHVNRSPLDDNESPEKKNLENRQEQALEFTLQGPGRVR